MDRGILRSRLRGWGVSTAAVEIEEVRRAGARGDEPNALCALHDLRWNLDLDQNRRFFDISPASAKTAGVSPLQSALRQDDPRLIFTTEGDQ